MALLNEALDILVRSRADDDAIEKVDKKLDKLGKTTSGVGETFKRAAVPAAAVVTALGAGAAVIGSQSIKAFSDLNEAVNASNVTFGTASQTLLDFGKTATTAVGLSERAFLQASVPIGASLQNVGLKAGEAADWTVKLTQRAADMASVFNTDVNDALGAIQAGLRGEADPLERFGVGLSDTALKGYAVAQGIAAADTEMTAQQKTMARLGLLMEQTNRVQGDFQNTSDGLANKQRILSAEIEKTQARIGEKLAPAMNLALEIGLKFVQNIETMVDWLKQNQGVAVVLAGVIGGILVGALYAAAAAAWAFITPLLPFVAAGGALAALIAGLDWLSRKVSGVGLLDQVTAAVELLIPKVKSLWEWLQKLGDKVMNSGFVKSLNGIGSQLANIKIPGFAHGGTFTVGGAPGVDRNLVAFAASKGETVTVTPRGQGGASAGQTVNVYIDKVLNDFDWEKVGKRLGFEASIAPQINLGG